MEAVKEKLCREIRARIPGVNLATCKSASRPQCEAHRPLSAHGFYSRTRTSSRPPLEVKSPLNEKKAVRARRIVRDFAEIRRGRVEIRDIELRAVQGVQGV
jgi:hypothetical protein